MIPTSTRIFVCTQPVDMRRSFDGLVKCTRELLEQDPTTGSLFLFTGKRATTLKALWWDTTGFCILYKRLARGVFRVPAAPSGVQSVLIDARELALILQGIELPTRKQRKPLTDRLDARERGTSQSADDAPIGPTARWPGRSA